MCLILDDRDLDLDLEKGLFWFTLMVKLSQGSGCSPSKSGLDLDSLDVESRYI